MTTTPRWTAIRDLPTDWEDLASDELTSLRDVWRDQAKQLRDSEAIAAFNTRLAREWAIETGILERLYTIDEGVSRLLVEQGFHASLIPHGATDQDPGYVLALLKDQHEVIQWLFDFVKAERPLSTSFIKEMHQLMTRHQQTTVAEDTLGRLVDVDLERGAWRKQPTRIARLDSHHYECCPPEQVASAMDSLVTMSLRHEKEQVPAEVEAAWLHHRFTEIHPFQDGNGRVARALATLALLRDGFFPLVVRRGDREPYLKALYSADAGDIGPLVLLFAKLQQRAFVDALSISRDILHEKAGLSDIVAAAADRLREKAKEQEKRMSGVFATADQLLEIARKRLKETATLVTASLSKVNKEFKAWSDSAANDSTKDDYFHYQIVEAAKALGYFANTRPYRAWCRLSVQTENQTDILVSLHCIGSEFRGVMVASALTYRRDKTTEEETLMSEVAALGSEPFLFNYNDPVEAVKTRFSKWLDQASTLGLDLWRRSL